LADTRAVVDDELDRLDSLALDASFDCFDLGAF
jgi:hypothetical protein